MDTHFWLRVWRKDYFELKRIGFGVVVDDVRLDAEVQYLRAIDPDIFIVRLTASEEVRRERVGGNLYGAADITERGWTDSRADIYLHCDNSLTVWFCRCHQNIAALDCDHPGRDTGYGCVRCVSNIDGCKLWAIACAKTKVSP